MANQTGLVSISFRKHTKEEILTAVKDAGLDSIEWGGDVHVPHGDEPVAKEAFELSKKYGILMPEYGSYYVIGQSEPELFDKVLLSARTLGTKVIRVWPGMNTSSDTLTNEKYEAYVSDARRICDLAPDITIALECHPQSLTDEYHTALKFIADIDRENLKMFWQPNQYRPLSYNLDAIRALMSHIVSVHVFSWSRKDRLPLRAGECEWKQYIELLSKKELCYMLEFMHDDNIETLKETASVLRGWLGVKE